jgi:hypothetical protein
MLTVIRNTDKADAIRNATSLKKATELVREYLASDKWMLRGLLAIYARQTADEKAAQTTRYDNDIGFNGLDAPILSSFAQQYQQRGWLSEKQLVIARGKMEKYAGQLARIARERREPAAVAS